jgi:hypothetical protein
MFTKTQANANLYQSNQPLSQNNIFNNQYSSNHPNANNISFPNQSAPFPNLPFLNNNPNPYLNNLSSNPYELFSSQAVIFNGIIKEIEQRVMERLSAS